METRRHRRYSRDKLLPQPNNRSRCCSCGHICCNERTPDNGPHNLLQFRLLLLLLPLMHHHTILPHYLSRRRLRRRDSNTA